MADGSGPDVGETLAESRYGRITRAGSDLVVTVFAGRRVRTTVFAETESGSDDAWDVYLGAVHRGRLARWLDGLAIAAVIFATLWIALLLPGTVVAAVALMHSSDGGQQSAIIELTYQLDRLAYSLFLGTTGAYGVTWLYRRGIPNQAK